MFYIQEYKDKFYVIEAEYEWIADIRSTYAEAKLSADYYNSNRQGESPFPDLQ